MRLRLNLFSWSLWMLPLEWLQMNEEAKVVAIDGSAELVGRLAEMGIALGTQIRMIQPGSPCIVAVQDQRYSLRGSASVLVEPLS